MRARHDQTFIRDFGCLLLTLFVLQETTKTFVLELIKQKLDVRVHANNFGPDPSNIGNNVQVISTMLIVN